MLTFIVVNTLCNKNRFARFFPKAFLLLSGTPPRKAFQSNLSFDSHSFYRPSDRRQRPPWVQVIRTLSLHTLYYHLVSAWNLTPGYYWTSGCWKCQFIFCVWYVSQVWPYTSRLTLQSVINVCVCVFTVLPKSRKSFLIYCSSDTTNAWCSYKS